MAIHGRTVQKYQVALRNGRHQWLSDEPFSAGGNDTAPTPVEMTLGALAACKMITATMYAARKEWPLDHIDMTVTHERVKGESGLVDQIKTSMKFYGDLTDEQRERILKIADKCPVHRMLTGDTVISSQLA